MSVKDVDLKKGSYLESTLVDKICSERQKLSYHKNNKFAGGKNRSGFLKVLSRYCEFEYDPDKKRYIITNTYDIPQSPYTDKMHKGIYEYLAPLILFHVYYEADDQKFTGTSADLARSIKVVNHNYNVMKYNQEDVKLSLGLDKNIILEYFSKLDNCVAEYLSRCLKYLESTGAIGYSETRMIGVMPKNAVIDNWHIIVEPAEIRKATEQEIRDYFEMSGKVSEELHIISNQEKWYGKKGLRYKTEISRLLRSEGLLFMCKAFEISVKDAECCKNIFRSFRDKTIGQRQQEVGMILKAIMDGNAEKRAARKQNLKVDYIGQFKQLSDITLLYDAEDIFKSLPSVKDKNYQDILHERYGYAVEYGLGSKVKSHQS